MKKLTNSISVVFVFLATCLQGCHAPHQDPPIVELDVMSFNIRNGKANDGDNSWMHRKELVYSVIAEDDPDIVGLQEAYRFQMDQLLENLPQYSEIGEGRDGGTRNEYSAILYRSERFEVEASGTFWLSDTPEVVSKHWGNSHHRICTWARLREKRADQAFYIYNTHLDHQSQNARYQSAKLIAQRIAARPTDDPIILTGDFNAGEDNPVIRYLKGQAIGDDRSPFYLVDSFRQIHPDQVVVGTGNGGYRGRKDGAKIDYVFISPGIRTLRAAIDQNKRDGRYPSDHYPVTARIQLTN